MSCTVHSAEGERLEISCGHASLAQAIWLDGRLPPPALCSGLGRCGRCRVRFLSPPPALTEEEKHTLTHEEAAAGIRLACRHPALPGAQVRLFPAAPPKRSVLAAASGHPLLLAVDLGTSSLVWKAFTPDGSVAAEGCEINPQMGAGSEIMSRLAAAASPEGKARLAGLARAALRDIVRILPAPVTEICLAANPAMTAVFLERGTEGLAHAPYRLEYRGGRSETLPGLPALWIPPLMAPFVGGDVSAGLAFLLACEKPEYPFLLADLGTNGEFALALAPGRGLAAGVPLGPALEGIGLSCGGPAEDGAVRAFFLEPAGLRAEVIGGGEGRGICATGYLSLLRILLNVGLLSPEGVLRRTGKTPLARRLEARMTHAAPGENCGEPRLMLSPSLYLGAHDVEAVLAVKAAFSLTLERLLEAANLRSASLRRVFVAGALGEHADAGDLEALGFFPPGLRGRFTVLGNSALKGAELLLREPLLRGPLLRAVEGYAASDMAADANFGERYMRHMRFAFSGD